MGSEKRYTRGVFKDVVSRFKDDAWREAPLFANLSKDEFDRVLTNTRVRFAEYCRMDSVLEEGQTVLDIGVLLEGELFIRNYYEDGKAQTINILYPRDLIGLDTVTSRIKTSPYTILSRGESAIMWIPYADLHRIDAKTNTLRDKIVDNLLSIYADELIRASHKADILSRHTVKERILAYLRIRARKKNGNVVEMTMTQAEFAEYLCVTRPSLSLALTELRRSGLIEMDGLSITLTGKGGQK
jgi:CRP-like cAMP-binding protein